MMRIYYGTQLWPGVFLFATVAITLGDGNYSLEITQLLHEFIMKRDVVDLQQIAQR